MSSDDYKDDDTTEFGPQKEITSKPAHRTTFADFSLKVLNLTIFIAVAVFVYHEAGLVTATIVSVLTASQAGLIQKQNHYTIVGNHHALITEMTRRRVLELTETVENLKNKV